jgi:hypothetical protein
MVVREQWQWKFKELKQPFGEKFSTFPNQPLQPLERFAFSPDNPKAFWPNLFPLNCLLPEVPVHFSNTEFA